MISEEGTPYLMDFGLAKRDAGEVTMTIDGQVLGTPAYMSPEQARGEAHKVDGLYQLLTGILPFRGNSRMLLHQVLHEEPQSPRGINKSLAKDLETICIKAMSKKPDRRYSSARELADDLRRFLSGEPISARPASVLERSVKRLRRRPLTAVLVVNGLLIIALIIAGKWYYSSPQKWKTDGTSLIDTSKSSVPTQPTGDSGNEINEKSTAHIKPIPADSGHENYKRILRSMALIVVQHGNGAVSLSSGTLIDEKKSPGIDDVSHGPRWQAISRAFPHLPRQER